jgi:hypothetical protein
MAGLVLPAMSIINTKSDTQVHVYLTDVYQNPTFKLYEYWIIVQYNIVRY